MECDLKVQIDITICKLDLTISDFAPHSLPPRFPPQPAQAAYGKSVVSLRAGPLPPGFGINDRACGRSKVRQQGWRLDARVHQAVYLTHLVAELDKLPEFLLRYPRMAGGPCRLSVIGP